LTIVQEAIFKDGSRKGMSLPALKKYIGQEHKDMNFHPHLLRSALKTGCEKDILKQDKNHYRLAPDVKKEMAKKAEKAEKAKPAAKKPKKKEEPKPAAAAKKPAAKKPKAKKEEKKETKTKVSAKKPAAKAKPAKKPAKKD